MDAVPFSRPIAAVQPARRWLELLARWGFAANGVVYLILGTIALRWAIGDGGHLTDPEGAFRALERQSFGRPMLIALIPGFFSYAVWRLLQAVFDGDHDGNRPGGLFVRAFDVLKGLLYAAVGVTAARVAFRASSSGSSWATSVLRSDAGSVVMVLVAAGLFAFACFEVYRAWRSELSEGLRLHGTGARTRDWIVGVSRFGIGARGAVIAVFAVLLFRQMSAGRRSVPAAAESVHLLGHVHPAVYVLGAAGIVAYGVYLLILARYRRVETS